MRKLDFYLKTEESPNGIVSFELAKDIAKSTKIITEWQSADVIVLAGLNIGYDFFFISSYTLLITLLLFLVSYKKTNMLVKNIGKTLMWAMLLAALLDIVENYALIKLLLGNSSQQWSALSYYAAISKFLIIGISVFYLIINALLFLIRNPLKK